MLEETKWQNHSRWFLHSRTSPTDKVSNIHAILPHAISYHAGVPCEARCDLMGVCVSLIDHVPYMLVHNLDFKHYTYAQSSALPPRYYADSSIISYNHTIILESRVTLLNYPFGVWGLRIISTLIQSCITVFALFSVIYVLHISVYRTCRRRSGSIWFSKRRPPNMISPAFLWLWKDTAYPLVSMVKCVPGFSISILQYWW